MTESQFALLLPSGRRTARPVERGDDRTRSAAVRDLLGGVIASV
jgi:hypothetical protein